MAGTGKNNLGYHKRRKSLASPWQDSCEQIVPHCLTNSSASWHLYPGQCRHCQHELCWEWVMQLRVATFLSHLQAFCPSCTVKKKKKVRNILFSGGVRKYCYSEQERTKSIPEPICRSLKSLHIVIKNRCQNLMSLMSLMAHQQSNQQHKAISEWKSFVTLWKTDTWHLVWQVTRHPCKWRNSVYSLESIKKHFCDPKGSGILKGLFRQSPSKATWHASPLPLHQERGFLIASQLTPLRRP